MGVPPLWPAQREAVEFALARPATMLDMGMGCGKTRVAIEAIRRRAERTCRMEQDPDYDFVRCSACGYEEESNILVAVGEGGLVVYGGNYCPNCGARVVEEEK